MLCENCGENEANIKYTQIINGVKKEIHLCDKCANVLGIDDISFDMPISFSNFIGDIFNDYEDTAFLSSNINNSLICKKCGLSYDEFLKQGKFGCNECYEVFKNKIDPVLKNIHGVNRHIGRNSEYLENKYSGEDKKEKNNKTIKNDINKENPDIIKDNEKDNKKKDLEELKNKLKQAINEEKYEDAAKIRDKIKELENK